MTTTLSPLAPVVGVTESTFEWVRYESSKGLTSETVYAVGYPNGRSVYAWSPDGEGCYFYDTLEELRAEHG